MKEINWEITESARSGLASVKFPMRIRLELIFDQSWLSGFMSFRFMSSLYPAQSHPSRSKCFMTPLEAFVRGCRAGLKAKRESMRT